MTFRFVASSLAAAILCAAGCASQDTGVREHVTIAASAIQGGTTDTSHNFAVAICGGVTPQAPDCQILCSGALIAPNLVVSARHCVDNVTSDMIDCGSTTFGPPLFPAAQYLITTDPDITDPAATWYPVEKIVTPTPTAFCGNDLSLLILGANVPTSEVPVLVTPEIWNPIDSTEYSSNETAIGYGVDAPSDAAADSAGVRRILEDINITCIPRDPSLDCGPVSSSGVATNEFAAGNGPCEGDSGSSAYEQNHFAAGDWLSFGVLSRGGVVGNTCEGSVYTQLYAWQSLIVQTAQEAATLGKYTAPAWTTNPADGSSPDSGSVVPSEDADLSDASVTESGHDSSGASEGGGKSDSGSLAPLGSTCSVNADCSSDVCVSSTGDEGFVCSVACTPTAPCPVDYNCTEGFCFAIPGPGTGAGASSPGSSGGCSVGAAARTSAGPEALPWAGVAVLIARKRRRRGARPGWFMLTHGSNR
jgi:hypothetical protein